MQSIEITDFLTQNNPSQFFFIQVLRDTNIALVLQKESDTKAKWLYLFKTSIVNGEGLEIEITDGVTYKNIFEETLLRTDVVNNCIYAVQTTENLIKVLDFIEKHKREGLDLSYLQDIEGFYLITYNPSFDEYDFIATKDGQDDHLLVKVKENEYWWMNIRTNEINRYSGVANTPDGAVSVAKYNYGFKVRYDLKEENQ